MALVDVVVVSYNSRRHLRSSVAALAKLNDVRVIVVDNASSDGSLDAVADIPVHTIRRAENGGFATGCNDGWVAGEAPHVLFLNPDASLDESSLRALVSRLDEDASLGLVAPRIEGPEGDLAWSQRRFPRLRSTYARALFLHRLLPQAPWTDELIRESSAYDAPGFPDWVSGAAMLVRRSALEEVGGWDNGFFLYGEDIDLCRRLRERGYEVSFEPSAVAYHVQGASAPSSQTVPLLAASRIRYGYKHNSRPAAILEHFGVVLEAATHSVASRGGIAARKAHLRALRVACSRANFGSAKPRS